LRIILRWNSRFARTQALLFKQASLGFVGQLKVFYTHTRRISD
jgi:hypothetical protein